MNQNMKKLTGWAAIIAVPTLVTSFVGMNVRFPLAGSVLGFWIYFAVMIVAGVVLYFLFRAKDWSSELVGGLVCRGVLHWRDDRVLASGLVRCRHWP